MGNLITLVCVSTSYSVDYFPHFVVNFLHIISLRRMHEKYHRCRLSSVYEWISPLFQREHDDESFSAELLCFSCCCWYSKWEKRAERDWLNETRNIGIFIIFSVFRSLSFLLHICFAISSSRSVAVHIQGWKNNHVDSNDFASNSPTHKNRIEMKIFNVFSISPHWGAENEFFSARSTGETFRDFSQWNFSTIIIHDSFKLHSRQDESRVNKLDSC